jgi:hypothetical protein
MNAAGGEGGGIRAHPRSPKRHLAAPRRFWAIGYLVLGVIATPVGVVRGIPGEPLGFGVPVATLQGAVFGWGTGISAAWPMLIALWIVGIMGKGPRWALTPLSGAFLIGGLLEPATWNAYSGRLGTTLAVIVWLNLLVPGFLLLAGLHRSRNDAGEVSLSG